MAFIHLNYYSHNLKYQTDLNVIIPTPEGDDDMLGGTMPAYFEEGKKYQVLYLLHGTCGDCYDWLIKTNAERLAQKYNVALVMPSCQNNFFLNMLSGPKYTDFLAKELPEFICGLLPVSKKREDTFIAGLSMGGYGAWHIALSAPERFGAAASLSGALDFPRGDLLENAMASGMDDIWPFKAMWGHRTTEDLVKDPNIHLIARMEQLLNEGVELPVFFSTVGTEDFTYGWNVSFRDKMKEMGIPLAWTEGPGSHNWFYWNEHLVDVLEWLPLRGETV